jgi:hypothetical protein
VPDAGSVREGDEIEQEADAGVAFSPSGPAAGATPDEIVRGFVQAQVSAADDFAIAKEFLAVDARDAWKPTDNVAVTSGTATVTANPVLPDDPSTRRYEFTQVAQVDSTGEYSEAVDPQVTSKRFRLIQEDGEWRITDLEPGIVLSAELFSSVFQQYSLYFFDPSYRYLVPDVRWFPQSGLTGSRIVDALLAGPSRVLQDGPVATAFPQSTTLGAPVTIDAGVAVVDFEDDAGSGTQSIDDTSLEVRGLMRQQLSASLSTFTPIVSVVLTAGGIDLDVPSTGAGAIVDPDVNSIPLVLGAGGLGFATASKLSPVEGISDAIGSLTDISGGEYATETLKTLAVSAAGGVYRVSGGEATIADDRDDLVAPSIDPFGFIWSSTRSGSIRAYDADGTFVRIETPFIPDAARLVSLDVSRDGTRLLLYLSSETGGSLIVVGVARVDGRTPSLSQYVELPVAAGEPLDAAWLDDQTVVTLAGADFAVVTSYVVGGPSARIGGVQGGISIAGGNGGTPGLRIRTSDGEVQAQRNATFQTTGVEATVLFSQQPG